MLGELNAMVVVAAGVALVLAGVALFLFLSVFKPWLMAFLANAPIPVVVIVAMKLRRTPVDTIVRYLIMAKQAGVDVSCADMERAFLQGVDLEKVTLAAVKAAREMKELSFSDLVTADLEDRLAEKLKG